MNDDFEGVNRRAIELHSTKAEWVWFLVWHTEYMVGRNNFEDLKAIYNDDYVITLDELPEWK